MKETLHQELSAKLKEFWTTEQRVPDQQQVDKTVELSQAVLKEEWEATKQLPIQCVSGVLRFLLQLIKLLRV